MTRTTGRRQWVGVVCLSLMSGSPALAQEPQRRSYSLWGEGIQIQVDPPVAFSPDGKMLASAGDDRKGVRLWDTATGKHLATLKGHTGKVLSLAFSPDGKTLASGDGLDDQLRSLPGKIKLWNVATGENTRTLEGHKAPVHAVAFGPDGKMLASASFDGCIKLWNAASGKNTANLEGSKEPRMVISVDGKPLAISPDGKLLASGGWDNTVKLWDIAGGKPVAHLKGHADPVLSLSFSPDGKLLACGSGGFPNFFHPNVRGEIKLWDVTSGKNTATFKTPQEPIVSVAFSPDGKTLAASDFGETVYLWDVAPDKIILAHTYRGIAWSVAFSPDGKTIATLSGQLPILRVKLLEVAKLLEVPDDKNTSPPVEHKGEVYALAFSPDGKTLASGSQDKTIKLWQVNNGRNTATFTGHTAVVTSVAFRPDGKRLASGSADRTIRLWELPSGQSTVLKGHTKQVLAVAFSPDGKTLASGGLDGVKLWDVASGRNIATLATHYNLVWSVAFSPDGKTLAAGDYGEEVYLWDVADHEKVTKMASLPGHYHAVNAVAFSPDGALLAAGSGPPFLFDPLPIEGAHPFGEIKVWNVARRQAIATFQEPDSSVHSLAFSPDGKKLLAAGKLRDRVSGKILASVGARGVFSPDGKILASAYGKSIAFWDMPAADREAPATKK